MKSILFLCNHAAFFVSHRLPIAISCKKKNINVKLLVGKPASNSMEKNAIKEIKRNKIDFDVLKYKSFTYNFFDTYQKNLEQNQAKVYQKKTQLYLLQKVLLT